MYQFDDNREKLLRNIKKFSDKVANNFFSNTFIQFDKSSQIKILDLFEATLRNNNRTIDMWNCFLIRNPQIISCITKELDFNSILNDENLNLEDKISFLNTYFNILYYTYSDFSKNDELNSIKSLVTFLKSNKECLTYRKFEQIIMTIYKNISEDDIKKLADAKVYEELEKIILQYIHDLDLSELINSDLVNVFIEISSSINVSTIIEALQAKCK